MNPPTFYTNRKNKLRYQNDLRMWNETVRSVQKIGKKLQEGGGLWDWLYISHVKI